MVQYCGIGPDAVCTISLEQPQIDAPIIDVAISVQPLV
jgi:hypothetical protein